MSEPLNVLLSAFACEPGLGSEPEIGWQWALQTARRHSVWVIASARHRTGVEAALKSNPLQAVRFVFVDLPRWMGVLQRTKPGEFVYYYLWQLWAFFTARRLHRKVGFDIAHHVSYVNYWTPSFLSFLGIPFVWGPVGGGESTPASFRPFYSFHGKVLETLRDAARLAAAFDPFTRATARRATLALATTEETAARIRRIGGSAPEIWSPVGISDEDSGLLNPHPVRRDSPFRLLSVGNFLYWKAFELGLRAFAILARENPSAEYWLIGDGPERRRMEEYVRSAGISGRVRFLGLIPRPKLLDVLAECDVLVHPSLHESGGCIVAEALAAGRPVVCLDLGGPALQVTPECGFKVAPTSPRAAVEEMAAAMRMLAAGADLRERMAEAARVRIRKHFHWDRVGDRMSEVYQRAIRKFTGETALDEVCDRPSWQSE